LLTVSLKRSISTALAGVVFGVVKKIAKGVDKKNFVSLVVPPLENFIIIMVAIIALEKLRFPDALNITVYRVSLRRIIEIAATITIVFSFIWLMLRIIDF